jgi:hypothetical protein
MASALGSNQGLIDKLQNEYNKVQQQIKSIRKGNYKEEDLLLGADVELKLLKKQEKDLRHKIVAACAKTACRSIPKPQAADDDSVTRMRIISYLDGYKNNYRNDQGDKSLHSALRLFQKIQSIHLKGSLQARIDETIEEVEEEKRRIAREEAEEKARIAEERIKRSLFVPRPASEERYAAHMRQQRSIVSQIDELLPIDSPEAQAKAYILIESIRTLDKLHCPASLSPPDIYMQYKQKVRKPVAFVPVQEAKDVDQEGR